MSEILAGSIALMPEANEQFQIIYGSFYGDDFVSLYAKFNVDKNKKITKVELRVINYTDSEYKPYQIKNAKFIEVKKGDYFGKKKCPEISLNTTVSINCLTLEVDIVAETGLGRTSWGAREEAYSIEMPEINISPDKNSYLEVVRPTDELGQSPQNLLNLKKCQDLNKTGIYEAAPGLICPRGYSRIFI